MKLTHINAQGRAQMVDVSEKDETRRVAVAFGKISMKEETLKRILDGGIKKGMFFRWPRWPELWGQSVPLKRFRCAIRCF